MIFCNLICFDLRTGFDIRQRNHSARPLYPGREHLLIKPVFNSVIYTVPITIAHKVGFEICGYCFLGLMQWNCVIHEEEKNQGVYST